MIRSFVAIELPQETKDKLVIIQEQINKNATSNEKADKFDSIEKDLDGSKQIKSKTTDKEKKKKTLNDAFNELEKEEEDFFNE